MGKRKKMNRAIVDADWIKLTVIQSKNHDRCWCVCKEIDDWCFYGDD